MLRVSLIFKGTADEDGVECRPFGVFEEEAEVDGAEKTSLRA